MIGYRIRFISGTDTSEGTVYDKYISTESQGYPDTKYLVKDTTGTVRRIMPDHVIQILGLDTEFMTPKTQWGASINE